MIRHHCATCGKRFQFRDEFAGRRTKCSQCGRPIRIPGPERPASRERKHSGLGIASFTVTVGAAIVSFLVLVVAGYLETTTPGGVDEESTAVMALGATFLGALLANVLALGMGVAALFEEHRRKTLAVLGAIFSSLMIVGFVILWVTLE